MKKIIALIVSCFVIVLAVACVTDTPPSQPSTSSVTMPVSTTSIDGTSASENTGNTTTSSTANSGSFASGPILLTSGGQSADFQMVSAILRNLNKEHSIMELAEPADLSGHNTLIVVVGGSSKGLGAAGIDANDEIARLTRLLDEAEAQGVTIITMHTGGDARRGDLSDRFIKPVFAYGDQAVVVASGDADGLISTITSENGVPLETVDAFTDILPFFERILA